MPRRERRSKTIATDLVAKEYGTSKILSLDNIHPRRDDQLRSPSSFMVAVRLGLHFIAMVGSILCFFGIIHLMNVFINLGPTLYPDWNFSSRAHYLSHEHPGLQDYPADITRDVRPVPCHSHNDYWRRTPLFEAIGYGCIGVEADVWVFPDPSDSPELYVGHSTGALSPKRTLRSLYVDPITELLDRANPPTKRLASRGVAPTRPMGVWNLDQGQTLVLLVDFKNDGRRIWPVMQRQLEPLRARGYLAHWNGTNTVEGPVTVVATGNAPFDLLMSNATYRDIFFDAPLATLYEKPDPIPGTASSQHDATWASTTSHIEEYMSLPADSFNETNSYYASVSFPKAVGRGHWLRGGPTPHQLRLIHGQIRGAKRRGLKPRYWGTPDWPIALRNRIWEMLVEEGVDLLNTNDLQAAATWDWSGKRHRTWVW